MNDDGAENCEDLFFINKISDVDTNLISGGLWSRNL